MEEEIRLFLAFMQNICPLLTASELACVGASLTVRELKKGEYFIRAGEVQKDLGFITKGLIRCFYIDGQGEEQTMRFLTNSEFVSNYAALLTKEPTRYNFQCLEPTTLVVLPFATVVESYDNSHQFERFGRLVAEKSCQLHQARIEAFIFETAEERYLNFIRKQPGLFNRISVTHLCSYIGVKRQSLTRIRKKLMKAYPSDTRPEGSTNF
jgi:CRP-like cAMP-binding protein